MTPLSEQPTSNFSALDTLAEQFSQWRATRPYRSAPVPLALRQQAFELLNHHPRSQVVRALGISTAMVRNWHAQCAGGSQPPSFVSLPTEGSTPEAARAPISFTLTYAQGMPLEVKGCFSPAQLAAFAQGLSLAQTREVSPV